MAKQEETDELWKFGKVYNEDDAGSSVAQLSGPIPRKVTL
jgi:hypothetical protein